MKIITRNAPGAPVKQLCANLPKTILCFSHLRWDFVFQRPQHLLTRFAKDFEVFYMEEPIFDATDSDHYGYLERGENLVVMVPHIRPGLQHARINKALKKLLDDFIYERKAADYIFWYYTPMAMEFSRHYQPELTVFDCMDELSAFKFAPESIKTLEKDLMQKADIVFTGGSSLYEAKKNQHNNIHAFPSSIDKLHFAKARQLKQARRKKTVTLGFYGVIDERFDIELIRGIAKVRPEWDIILIGPVVKIDPATLPVGANIRYTGPKSYGELPELMAQWDIALIPFLLNESTRFISPTKTPEYLAAGLPVVSTPIRDVINPYSKFGLVSIGHNAGDFVAAAERELHRSDHKEWLQKVDFFLAHNSWDLTCEKMTGLLSDTILATEFTYNTLAQS
jgi:glycosyltransferase involved in cell wall biosynthesis